MKLKVEELQKEADKEENVRTLAYCGAGLASLSFLRQVIALALTLTRKKKNGV